MKDDISTFEPSDEDLNNANELISRKIRSLAFFAAQQHAPSDTRSFEELSEMFYNEATREGSYFQKYSGKYVRASVIDDDIFASLDRAKARFAVAVCQGVEDCEEESKVVANLEKRLELSSALLNEMKNAFVESCKHLLKDKKVQDDVDSAPTKSENYSFNSLSETISNELLSLVLFHYRSEGFIDPSHKEITTALTNISRKENFDDFIALSYLKNMCLVAELDYLSAKETYENARIAAMSENLSSAQLKNLRDKALSVKREYIKAQVHREDQRSNYQERAFVFLQKTFPYMRKA